MGEEEPRPLDYAAPTGDSLNRRQLSFPLQFVCGFCAAVFVVLLLIPATGEGPMVPAVLRAIAKVVGPAAIILLVLAILARRYWRWRGFLAGVIFGFVLAGLVAGICVASAP